VFINQNEENRLRTAAVLARITLLVFEDFASGWQRLFNALGT
jgi:hypothetical protein